jgi:hypothetical protein
MFFRGLTDVSIFEIEGQLKLEEDTLQSRRQRKPGSCELPGFLLTVILIDDRRGAAAEFGVI